MKQLPSLSPHWPQRRLRGFFVMDVLLGLGLAVGLLIMFTVTIIKADHAERKLAASRQSTRMVEDALLSLQAGKPAPAGIVIEKIVVAADPSLPPRAVWLKLTLPGTPTAPAASLIGLVPDAGIVPPQPAGGQPK